jgi:hypothetical protein
LRAGLCEGRETVFGGLGGREDLVEEELHLCGVRARVLPVRDRGGGLGEEGFGLIEVD